LDEKLDLTDRIHRALSADPHLEIGWDPQLTVVAFRVRGGDEARNRALLARINASRRVFLSSTLIRDEYWLRVCIVSHRTHADRIDECAAIIREAAAAIAD
jgi:aromatic-L-amino-acid decarboxylase